MFQSLPDISLPVEPLRATSEVPRESKQYDLTPTTFFESCPVLIGAFTATSNSGPLTPFLLYVALET